MMYTGHDMDPCEYKLSLLYLVPPNDVCTVLEWVMRMCSSNDVINTYQMISLVQGITKKIEDCWSISKNGIRNRHMWYNYIYTRINVEPWLYLCIILALSSRIWNTFELSKSRTLRSVPMCYFSRLRHLGLSVICIWIVYTYNWK